MNSRRCLAIIRNDSPDVQSCIPPVFKQVYHDPYSVSANRQIALIAVPVEADNCTIIMWAWMKYYLCIIFALGDN